MIKSVNFNGYATPLARSRRARRAFSAKNLVATLRALGMSDEEIKAALLKTQPVTITYSASEIADNADRQAEIEYSHSDGAHG